MFPTKSKTKQGAECDACPTTNTTVTFDSRGDMWLCEACLVKSNEAYKIQEREVAAAKLVEGWKQNYETINLVTDLHNAKTPAIVALKQAITDNPAIVSEEKQLTYCNELKAHILKLEPIIFETRGRLDALLNEKGLYQTNLQSEVGKLRSDLRAQFETERIDYQVVKAPKKPAAEKKPSAPKKSAKVQVKEAKEAAEKYGIAWNAIQMLANLKGISADDAAQMMVGSK